MMNSQLSSLPFDPSRIPLLIKLVEQEQSKRIAQNKLKTYAPYTKQREFHAAGAVHSERLFMAGNQLGKTVAGGAEWAMHLTGRYPDWWKGAEFTRPPNMWAAGVTRDSTRDNPQRVLIGPPSKEEEWGTGMIPKECLVGWDRAHGVANLLDNVQVKWGGGGDVQAGTSVISFKSYDQGREKWQGPTLEGVWWDEEPPLEIYTEGLTRTNAGQRGQFGIITFTPLKGMTEVVRLFPLGEKKGSNGYQNSTP